MLCKYQGTANLSFAFWQFLEFFPLNTFNPWLSEPANMETHRCRGPTVMPTSFFFTKGKVNYLSNLVPTRFSVDGDHDNNYPISMPERKENGGREIGKISLSWRLEPSDEKDLLSNKEAWQWHKCEYKVKAICEYKSDDCFLAGKQWQT